MSQINPQAVRGPVTAVPVVAGKGVRFTEDVENNRVVAEVDETVLWEGSTITGQINLSESSLNFEKLIIKYATNEGYITEYVVYPDANVSRFAITASVWNGSTLWIKASRYNISANSISVDVGCQKAVTTTITNASNDSQLTILKVVGINRVASA